ncbi:hypothetical protein BJ742DRAFT_367002 [Cladochytrium replicatum]|nr:hypothetical protein BJ742DRAFT_367002 [Cladochytrium replicatum]
MGLRLDVVCLDGETRRSQTEDGPRAFILTLPRGTYTVLRAATNPNEQPRVVLLDHHLDRLSAGVAETVENVRNYALETLRNGLCHLGKQHWETRNWTVCIWVARDNQPQNEPWMSAVFIPFVPAQQKECEVSIAPPFVGRTQPEIKDTKWVSDRIPVERSKPAAAHEVILSKQDGALTLLLEGLTTNFIVLKHTAGLWVLQTAPSDLVLEGTSMQGLLHHVISRNWKWWNSSSVWAETGNGMGENICVERSSPALEQAGEWVAAIVLSVNKIWKITAVHIPSQQR